jgi:hypothetical protein
VPARGRYRGARALTEPGRIVPAGSAIDHAGPADHEGVAVEPDQRGRADRVADGMQSVGRGITSIVAFLILAGIVGLVLYIIITA